MLLEREAACPHCGQMVFVLTSNPNTPEAVLTEMAEDKCSCPEAVMARGMRETEQSIEKLLGEDAMNLGFDYVLGEDRIEAVREVCRHILLGRINNVTLKDQFGDIIKLVKNGNSVKIRRSCKKQVEM